MCIKKELNKMARGLNKSYYHFILTDKQVNEPKFYKTCKEITKDYGLCKATIYNIINNKHRSIKYPNLNIEIYYQPI